MTSTTTVGERAAGAVSTAVVLVLGGAVSLQFGAAFAALLFGRVGALGAVTLRTVVAAVVLLLVVRPRLGGHSRTDYAVVVMFGLVLATMNALFYQALVRLPIGVAVTLEFLGPLGLALVTSRRFRDLLWVGCAGAGILLLGGGAPDGLDWVGVAFALGAGVCWACYILLSAQTGKRFQKADGLAIAMVVGGLAILPFGFLTAGTALLHPLVLGVGALVALMSSVIPYTLELLALRRISPGTFGILMSLDPAIAAVVGAAVLEQLLGVWQCVAIGLVVVASVGVTAQARRRRVPAPDAETEANEYLA